jgi:hypothetical protein
LRTGLRNSSIGVPMVMMIGPSPEMRSDECVKTRRRDQRLAQHVLGAALDERQPAGS